MPLPNGMVQLKTWPDEACGSVFARRSAPVFRIQAGGSGISNKSLTRQRRRARPVNFLPSQAFAIDNVLS